MIHQYYRAAYYFSVFAALVAAVLLTVSDRVVRSQDLVETMPSPFEFERLLGPKRDNPRITSAGTSPGSLIEKWTFDFGTSEGAGAIAVQPDGKIVAAGTVHVSGDPSHLYSDRDFVVFRYNADGSLDTTFDADGKLTTSFGDGNDSAHTVAVQTDGKIVAAGLSITVNGNFRSALVRYNTDGSLDSSFGAGGKVITAGWSITDIVLQADGRIVAARGWNGFSVARYNGDGSLDASFGTGGIATTEFGGNWVNASSVSIQADGRIVAAGNAGFCDKDGCSSNFALARYNPNGSPDASFDTDGKLTTTFSNYDFANEVVVQTDGKIIAAGFAFGLAVARYNGDGSLDNSFDGDGKVTSDTFGANSAVLQSDGKIIVCGTGGDFALSRLNADGSLDTSFDGDGTVTTDFGGWDVTNDVAVLPTGKIVTVGNTRNGQGFGSSTDDFALARYNADGSLDTSFDADGKQTSSWLVRSSAATAVVVPRLPGAPYNIYYVGYSTNGENDDFAIAIDSGGRLITPIGDFHDRAYAAAFGPDLKIVAVGSSENGSNNDFALVRYHGLGLDTSFDGDGKLTTDFGSDDTATAVAVQPDGRIVVVGQTIISGNSALAIARYNNNGSLDASFGTGGKVVLQGIQHPKAMAIQPDGKIVAAGRAGQDFAIARFNANGSLDTTFDSDGVTVTTFGLISQINSIALQPYGKIVAAGFIFDFDANSTDFALARYNVDGSLDMSFDGDGKVTTSFNTSSAANAVSVQRNGKIVAVGSASTNSALNFALARYNYDGSLDTTFDTDGKQTTDFFAGDDISLASTFDPYGNVIAVGSASRDGRTDLAVASYTGDPQRKIAYDFDDDGVAELSVYRPSNGVWYLNRSTLGFYATQLGGSLNDRIAPADYDADCKTDVAVYRDGLWHLRTSRFSSNYVVYFGLPDDIPVPADYDGDGRADITIYRNGQWWMITSTDGEISVVQFGLPGDKPVPADYDGDRRTDQAVYRDGEWHINGSSQGYTVIRFGLPNDKPIPADYDGDGKADLAVYRDGIWYFLQSTDGFAAFQWGLLTDVPVPADYDGDGKTDAAVFRDGTWYLLQSASGISIQQFGLAGDKPVPAAY